MFASAQNPNNMMGYWFLQTFSRILHNWYFLEIFVQIFRQELISIHCVLYVGTFDGVELENVERKRKFRLCAHVPLF
jgi:hypothetical protein